MMTRAEVNIAYKLRLAVFLHLLGLKAPIIVGPMIWYNMKKDAHGHLIFDKIPVETSDE